MNARSIKRFFKIYKKKIHQSLFIFFLVIAVIYLYFIRIIPPLTVSASSITNIEINKKINECCLSYFESVATTDFISITYDSNFRISGVNVNTGDINRARFSISRSILYMMKSSEVKSIKVPLGCIFNSNLIYAKGPKIDFRILSGENFTSGIESKFTEKGINQTLFEMYMTFSVEVTLSMPLKSIVIPIETQYLLAEAIIVGDVPEAFTDINRTFDDITESEIDDINDFGAQR